MRQGRAVSKDVRQPQHPAVGAETFFEIALAVEHLAHERLSGGNVAVCLQPQPPVHLHASLRNALAQGLKQGRIILFQPSEQLRSRLEKRKRIVTFKQTQHPGKGAAHFLPCLAVVPQPGDVNVGMAHGHDLNRAVGATVYA